MRCYYDGTWAYVFRRMIMKEKYNIDRDTAIDFPLVKITKQDVLGALFVHFPQDELYHDALLKLQTWILNFAEEQVKPLRECDMFTEEDVEDIKKKYCVISPLTLTLFLQYVQMEQFIKLSDVEKEAFLLHRMPERFKARFAGNAANRDARETDFEDEDEKEDVSQSNNIQSLDEFLKMLGQEILKEKNHG